MKKALLFILFSLIVVSGFSQTRKDFFAFIDSFNWGLSEDSFVEKYSKRILPKTDSAYVLFAANKEGVYWLNDLRVGDYNCYTAIIFIEEGETPSIVACFDKEVLDSALPSVLCEKLDNCVRSKMGEPDMLLENVPLASMGLDLPEDTMGSMDIWMTDAILLSSIKATTENGLGYFIVARKAEPREPDFRKGKWGDSMAECKRKEGKTDTYQMEGIYAFDTYVAGISCAAAYRFTDDILTSGKYIFTGQNADNCIENYESLVDLLTKKYGEPTSVNEENNASDYEKKYYSEGELIKMGKVKKTTIWYTPFTTIAIFLNGEQYSISLSIEYYGNKVKKVREDAMLKDL